MMYSALRAAALLPFSAKLSTFSCVFMLTGCSSLMAQEPAPIYHRSLPPGGHVYPITAEYQTSSLPTTLATHGAPPTSSTTTPQNPPAVTIYAATNPAPLTPQHITSDVPIPAAAVPTSSLAIPPAPTPQNSDLPPETYTVQAGDNLFRIALNNGLGYRELAELNQIDNPNEIKVGQVLRLRTAAEVHTLTQPSPIAAPQTPPAPPPVTTATPATPKPATPIAPNKQNTSTVKTYPKAIKLPYSDHALTQISALATGIAASSPNPPAPKTPVPPTPKPTASATTPTAPAPQTPTQQNRAWQWPTQGKVIARFTEQNKGIDIAGSNGQAIFAAREGKVVYSGTGLRGYGKLLILKHDQTFLSAYAHNRELLVKEGDDVKKGQKIAEMGNTDSSQYKLHFEIRRFGKPVDPLPYIGQP